MDPTRDLPTPAASPRIRLARPDVGEEELAAIAAVFASGALTNGPATRSFEAAFAAHHDAEHGVAFANGTVALTAMYVALGIGEGDEVIVPSLTFISTATSVLHVGATPVFADVQPDTYDLDPADAARKVTRRTKAIVPVHYGGQAADLDELSSIAAEAGAALLEDAAEAHGATYRGRPVGAIGHAGMFSFTPTKNMTTGEGGMVLTDDGELARRLRSLRNHGQSDVYRHDELGWNWRMSDIAAAMGEVQLRKLPAILERKRSIAARLTSRLEGLEGISAPITRPDRDHVFMLYSAVVETGRDQVLAHLLAEGIEARLYFPPAHRQPIFADTTASLPVTDSLARSLLALPVHSRLTDHEVDEIGDAVERALASLG